MAASPVSGTSSFGSHEFNLFGRLRRRILINIVAGVSWLSLALIYLAFWASHFTLFQSIVLLVVSLLVLGGVIVGSWISFGLGFVDRWDD